MEKIIDCQGGLACLPFRNLFDTLQACEILWERCVKILTSLKFFQSFHHLLTISSKLRSLNFPECRWGSRKEFPSQPSWWVAFSYLPTVPTPSDEMSFCRFPHILYKTVASAWHFRMNRNSILSVLNKSSCYSGMKICASTFPLSRKSAVEGETRLPENLDTYPKLVLCANLSTLCRKNPFLPYRNFLVQHQLVRAQLQ